MPMTTVTNDRPVCHTVNPWLMANCIVSRGANASGSTYHIGESEEEDVKKRVNEREVKLRGQQVEMRHLIHSQRSR